MMNSQTTYGVKIETEVMQWIKGKLNVPDVLEHWYDKNVEYMIGNDLENNFSERNISCQNYYFSEPEQPTGQRSIREISTEDSQLHY